MRKTAVYCASRNIYADIIPSLKSLLINSDVERVYLVIQDDKFPYEVPSCVEAVNVSEQTFFKPGSPNWFSKWTYMTMMKAALSKLFPEEDKMLSIDPDAIVAENISELWDLDLYGKYYAAVKEPSKSTGAKVYTNMGVCLYNLKELRDSGMADRVIRELNTRRYRFAEQDCFHELCQGKIALMPSEYNSCEWTEIAEHPKIIHYAAIKDWQSADIVKKYRDIPWSEIRS